MKLKHYDLEIPKDGTNPFVNCKLDRRRFADILTDFVSTYNDGFVLAVNNEWGSGKTTFIKMWKQELVNKGFRTLYFNAWENDFEKDVLVALISELEDLKDSDTKEAYNKLLQKAALLTKKIGPGIINAALKKYAGVKSEDLLNIINGSTEIGFEALEAEIKIYTTRKKNLEEFRVSLKKFVKKANSELPVIFFIDELDRCRPNYAVEVLEEIKHMFSVPGIIFVLSIDKEQLGHAICGVYGSEYINSEEYLRRFIDMEYKIPRPNIQKFVDYLYDYFDYKDFLEHPKRIEHYEFNHDVDTFKNIAVKLFSKGGFELRHIEKIFAKIRLVLKGFSQNQFIFPELILLVVYISEKHPSFYNKISRQQINIQQFVDGLDEVLNPFENSPNQNQVLNLYASFLWRYYVDYSNLYHKSSGLLLDNSNPEKIKLTVNSKFENENRTLAQLVKGASEVFHTSDLGLSWLFEKYNLTSNFQS